jgi:hypothetical protein
METKEVIKRRKWRKDCNTMVERDNWSNNDLQNTTQKTKD